MHEDHHHEHELSDHEPHSHPHHSHTHPHGEGKPGDIPRIKTLLGYMLEHNREHVEELGSLAHEIRHAGLDGAADILEAGLKDFERGNERLAEALGFIEGRNP